MRDPKRIKPIINYLEALWNKYPDQRFGQLIYNYFYPDGKIRFHEEDDRLMERIQEKSRRRKK